MKRLPRAERVLPFAILLGAVVLGVSEFMSTFEFTPPGGEPLRESLAGDRHHYAMLVLAVFVLAAMVFAIATGSRPAALAVAVTGVVALLLFLVVDLPDAGKLGDLEDPIRGLAAARAEPQSGFWLEALGAITLALACGAFATLTPTQLRETAKPIVAYFRSDPPVPAGGDGGAAPEGGLVGLEGSGEAEPSAADTAAGSRRQRRRARSAR